MNQKELAQGKILIVDDNDMNRKMLTERLSRKGHIVSAVANGKDALNTIDSENFEVILLDIMMPDVSGLEILKQLRLKYQPIELSIIMVTAKISDDDLAHSLALGANDYITKPINFKIALARITTQINLVKINKENQALSISEERYSLAIQGANDGLWDWDIVEDKIYYSPRWKSILGYTNDQIGSDVNEWFERIHPDERNAIKRAFELHRKDNSEKLNIEHRIKNKNETYIWVLVRGLAVADDKGNVIRIAGSMTDISARKQAEQQLRHDALHDHLTNLPNRTLFLEHLSHAVSRKKRRKDYLFGILFLDIDRFKTVNDTYGHPKGDELIKSFAQIISSQIRTNEKKGAIDIVARFGGDEFGILVDDIESYHSVMLIAKRISNALKNSIQVFEHSFNITASIGISLPTLNQESPEDLLRNADIAMYKSKQYRDGRAIIFDNEMYQSALRRTRLEEDLIQAISKNEISLAYQPIMNTLNDQLTGMEALARWKHSELGFISPIEFIALAESNGSIRSIGQYLVEESMKALSIINNASKQSLNMHINISPMQIEPEFVNIVKDLIKKYALKANFITFEITENVLLERKQNTLDCIHKLRKIGFQVSIDDFGTGFSSLSYLRELPISNIKIDRSFIQEITNFGTKAIIEAIITISTALEISVIAEGVEEISQRDLLNQMHCHFQQGYLFAKPMIFEDILKLIKAKHENVKP